MAIPITLNQLFLVWFGASTRSSKSKKKRPKNRVFQRIFETSLEAPSRLPLKNFPPPFFCFEPFGLRCGAVQSSAREKTPCFHWTPDALLKNAHKIRTETHRPTKKTWWPYVYFSVIERKNVFFWKLPIFAAFFKKHHHKQHIRISWRKRQRKEKNKNAFLTDVRQRPKSYVCPHDVFSLEVHQISSGPDTCRLEVRPNRIMIFALLNLSYLLDTRPCPRWLVSHFLDKKSSRFIFGGRNCRTSSRHRRSSHLLVCWKVNMQ